MNIAVIIGSDILVGGGFQQELATILLLHRYKSKKYNFIYFTSSRKNVEFLKKYGINVSYFKFNYFDRKINILRVNKYLKRFIRRFKVFKYNKFDNILLKNEIDLIFFLNPSSLSLKTEIHNYIITVWDLCHRDHLEFPEVGKYNIFWGRENLYKNALPKAVAVIAESNLGRENIIRRYNIDKERVVSIPHLPSNSVKITEEDYKANYIDIVGTAIVVFSGLILSGYFSESKDKRLMRKQFERYVSDTVLEEILANPTAVDLMGRTLPATVMATDIANFTTISEELAPHEVVSRLNDYLSEVSEVLIDNKAFINKLRAI